MKQWRRRRWFVVNNLWTCSRAESDLMHLRWLNSGGTDSLIAKQLIRSRLLIIIPLTIVENILVMVAAIFVIVERL